jgi:hypothetical protein
MTLFSNKKRISQDRRLRRSATEFDSLICLTHVETHGLLGLVRCLLFNLEIWTAIVWRYGLSQQWEQRLSRIAMRLCPCIGQMMFLEFRTVLHNREGSQIVTAVWSVRSSGSLEYEAWRYNKETLGSIVFR